MYTLNTLRASFILLYAFNIRADISELEPKVDSHTEAGPGGPNLCSPVKQHMLRLGSQAAAGRIQSGLYTQLPLTATGFWVLKKADPCTQRKL